MKMETFNELINLLILYHLICFSEFVGDPLTRRKLGFVYIGAVCFFALVHLTIMLRSSIKQGWSWLKQRYSRWQEKRKKEPLATETVPEASQ